MKKILSLILTAAMLMSAVVMTTGAEEIAPISLPETKTFDSLDLDENQVDSQGIYYTLDSESMTAIVGKNTYSDTASADAGLATKTVSIPKTVNFGGNSYNVTTIGRNAFDGTDIEAVIFYGETIGEFAFAGCTSLKYAHILADEIKGFAFWGCTSLITVNLAKTKSIGGGAFWNCSNLQNPAIFADVIMEKAFAGCTSVENFVFYGDAPAVGADAFDSSAKALISEGAAGFDDFPIETAVRTSAFYDVEDVYAEAGETVNVNINFNSLAAGEYEVVLTLADGISVDNTTIVVTNDVNYIGTGALVCLDVAVDAAATAGTYAITATINGVEANAGSVTICDHADTKTVTVKAASCDEAGVEKTVCTACGEVLSTADVEAKGHAYTDFVIAPTCTEGGYTRHICNCCSDAYTDAETEALGHAWDEGNVKVQASTSKEGLITYTCTTCGTTKDVKVPKIVYGDANGDSKINLGDASLILKYVAKWNLEEGKFNSTNADVNGDSKINLGDVSLLLKYIAKWDVTFGPKK